MSKTTFVLLFFLVTGIGILLYLIYGPVSHSFISSLSAPIRSAISPVNTSLSFSAVEENVQPGKTVTIAVMIHHPDTHPNLIQLEISYDPTVLTVDSLMPGTFFTDPTVALQNIDPSTGRISYALHCPGFDGAKSGNDCVSGNSGTVAVITFISNRYAYKNATTLSFLPKTVVRSSNGRDILQTSNNLTLTINNSFYPVASSSSTASPEGNFNRINPVH